MGKPSWEDAPDWANYLVQDECSRWYWYEGWPVPGSISWEKETYGQRSELAGISEANPFWRDTLESRPKEQDMTDETMTFPQVLRLMAENVEAGRPRMVGMEYKSLDGTWRYPAPSFYLKTIQSICAKGGIRRALRTTEVAGVQVPEPMREAPWAGTQYWLVSEEGEPSWDEWAGDVVDYARLSCGNIFATEEGAQARAKAERRLFGKGDEE